MLQMKNCQHKGLDLQVQRSGGHKMQILQYKFSCALARKRTCCSNIHGTLAKTRLKKVPQEAASWICVFTPCLAK